MGKASSAKKVAKVARSSAVGGPGGPRRIRPGFSALVVLVLVLGVTLVLWSRASRDTGPSGPDAAEQWAITYGVYVCNEFVADGTTTVSPIDETAPTGRTTIGSLLGGQDVTLTDGSVTLADGTEIATGDDCDGEPGVLSVTSWDAGSPADSTGLRRDSGYDAAQLSGDGEQLTIALAPAGTEIPRPPASSAPAPDVDPTTTTTP